MIHTTECKERMPYSLENHGSSWVCLLLQHARESGMVAVLGEKVLLGLLEERFEGVSSCVLVVLSVSIDQAVEDCGDPLSRNSYYQ